MAKKVIVGGRIESKEVGGIVTGAAEILDDTKGKKQNVINQETDAEMERLDGAKQDVLTFDNTPTEGSNNPVTSGGLYLAQLAIIQAIAAINELIPSAASALNKLADTAFVNSSISTNTATFRGTSASGLTEQQFLAWANGLTHDLNDYVFWQTVDAAGNTLFKRYKWNGTEWAYEYTLNNSTFTAEQWEAIQSGITALLVTKLRALPTAQELIQSFDGKQDVLTFDDTPTLGSNNPVKSSGIYNVIKAITDLIPAEATAQNQLADKADVAAKILAAIPSWKGQYDTLTELQAVTGAKAGDMGCVKTTDSDGHAVLTFYQYSAQGTWVEYYVLRHYAQSKPATTGTTGDYPYNGMGRIELQKNIVNGVNTLTQAMLTQQNTIYVIQYDFTLGEDITVPANCVLEFDGGSIIGAYTLTGSRTIINAGLVKILDISVTLAGNWKVKEIYPQWFGAVGDGTTDDYNAFNKSLQFVATNHLKLFIPSGIYYISQTLHDIPVLTDNDKYGYIIEGEGTGTILKAAGGETPDYSISTENQALLSIHSSNNVIRNLTIRDCKVGIFLGKIDTTQTLVGFNCIEDIKLKHIGVGISIESSDNGGVYYNKFINIHIKECNVGVYNPNNAAYIQFNRNTFLGIRVNRGYIGYYMLGGDGNSFYDCHCEDIQNPPTESIGTIPSFAPDGRATAYVIGGSNQTLNACVAEACTINVYNTGYANNYLACTFSIYSSTYGTLFIDSGNETTIIHDECVKLSTFKYQANHNTVFQGAAGISFLGRINSSINGVNHKNKDIGMINASFYNYSMSNVNISNINGIVFINIIMPITVSAANQNNDVYFDLFNIGTEIVSEDVSQQMIWSTGAEYIPIKINHQDGFASFDFGSRVGGTEGHIYMRLKAPTNGWVEGRNDVNIQTTFIYDF